MIEHKICFYLLKKEFFPSPEKNPGAIFVTAPFPPKTPMSSIRTVIDNNCHYIDTDRSNKDIQDINNYDKLELLNTKFKIKLVQEVSTYIKYVGGSTGLLVEVIHPELEKYYPVYILVYSGSLLKALCMSGGMEDGTIFGTFSFEHNKHETYGMINIVLEDYSDKVFTAEKELTKLISTTKGTSKWIIGHRYLLKSGHVFIYLGEFTDDILYCESYSGEKDYRGSYNLLCNMSDRSKDASPYLHYTCPTTTGKVVLFEDFQCDDDTSSIRTMIKSKDTTVYSILQSALSEYSDLLFSGKFIYGAEAPLHMFSNKIPVTAIDLGVALLDDVGGTDITEFISSILFNKLTHSSATADYSKYAKGCWYLVSKIKREIRESEEFKKWWKDHIIKVIVNEIQAYNSRSWIRIKIEKDIEDVNVIFDQIHSADILRENKITSFSSDEISEIIRSARDKI